MATGDSQRRSFVAEEDRRWVECQRHIEPAHRVLLESGVFAFRRKPLLFNLRLLLAPRVRVLLAIRGPDPAIATWTARLSKTFGLPYWKREGAGIGSRTVSLLARFS